MFAGKQFDIVMGVDIHLIQPPGPVPPVPVPHPFIGMVYDPESFFPFIGSNLKVNYIPGAVAGSPVIATIPHIPIGGVFVKPPANAGEVFMGSISVNGEGEPLSFTGCPVLTCHDFGIVSIPRKKKKSKLNSFLLPTSTLYAIPVGKPILLSTGMTISWNVMIGKIQNAYFKKINKKINKNRGVIVNIKNSKNIQSNNISKTINAGKQGKHIVGHNNYREGRSILTEDAQTLLDDFHTGNIKSTNNIDAVKTKVDFGKQIGFHVDEETKIKTPTTVGMIHNSKSGVHIVPARPKN